MVVSNSILWPAEVAGHIFNLGHGIDQHVDPVNAGAFIEAVHEFSGQYHR